MWPLKNPFLFFTLALIGCSQSVHPIVVDLAAKPFVPATAKIKQLAAKAANPNPSSCKIPCSVTVEKDDNFEVSLDAPGFYPAAVQFDYELVVNEFDYEVTKKPELRREGVNHLPLVIPLLERIATKDNSQNNHP